MDEKEYIKGFNSGYLLSKHDPELLEKILKTPNDSGYLKGMETGKKQHDREKLLEQLKQSQKRSKGREREK